jgi:hypothetical protein
MGAQSGPREVTRDLIISRGANDDVAQHHRSSKIVHMGLETPKIGEAPRARRMGNCSGG